MGRSGRISGQRDTRGYTQGERGYRGRIWEQTAATYGGVTTFGPSGPF